MKKIKLLMIHNIFKNIYSLQKFNLINSKYFYWGLGIGDWGFGVGGFGVWSNYHANHPQRHCPILLLHTIYT